MPLLYLQYQKVDDEMYLQFVRNRVKEKRERAKKRAFMRAQGLNEPSSEEEEAAEYDEYGDKVRNVVCEQF